MHSFAGILNAYKTYLFIQAFFQGFFAVLRLPNIFDCSVELACFAEAH